MTTEQKLLNELKTLRSEARANDPRLVEPLRRLAMWYCKHRHPHRARPLVQELCGLYTHSLGATHQLTVGAVGWLASILASTGKLERAEEVLTELVGRLRKDQDLALEKRAAIWNQLVEIHYQRSNPIEALYLCREVLVLLGDTPLRRASLQDPACRAQLNRARNNLAVLHVARGEYREAQRAYVRNLRDARLQNSEGFALVTQLTNLASVLRLRGDMAKSERLTVRAIRQCQKASGWYHPLVAQGMANLGGYRLQGGRPASALSLYRKALKIRRRLHPPGHPQISRSLRHLAEAYLALGQHGDAERFLERTRLQIEKQKPLDEVHLAQTLCSLGFLYLAAGRLANCERTLMRALEIQERLLGTENSQLIQTLNGLGCMNAVRGNFAASLDLHRRALNLAERSLGPDHPELAKTLIWLCEVDLARGDFQAAKGWVKRALSIREASLGPDHPLVAEAMVRRGQLALALGRPARALSIGARAKQIYQKATECPPLALADVLAIAGEASRRLLRCRGAEELSLEELRLREKVVGPDHVTLLPAIRRLAWSYTERDMFTEAERTLRRGLTIAEKTLGSAHEGGIHFAEHLSRLSIARNDFEQASQWMERTVKLCQQRYGVDAEEVAETLLKFASSLRTARREEDADRLESRAIELRNRNCHVLL